MSLLNSIKKACLSGTSDSGSSSSEDQQPKESLNEIDPLVESMEEHEKGLSQPDQPVNFLYSLFISSSVAPLDVAKCCMNSWFTSLKRLHPGPIVHFEGSSC